MSKSINDKTDPWFRCHVDRNTVKQLSRRTNWHGLIFLGAFLLCVGLSGWLAYEAIGTHWMVPAFLLYGSIWIFATSVVHEACHGTPFRNRLLNETVLFVIGLMVQQSPCVLRYTHANHHSRTAINGEDVEIVLKNPVTWSGFFFKQLLDVKSIFYYFRTTLLMSLGMPDCDIKKCVPESEMNRAIIEARAYLVIYLAIVVWSLMTQSWIPVLMLLFPRVAGGPMHGVILATQHLGMAQDMKDHRHTTRTMYINPLLRLLYWNMNYHIEHHMYSNVPFHALPRLHKIIADQCPQPTRGVFGALKEMWNTVKQQQSNPEYAMPRGILN